MPKGRIAGLAGLLLIPCLGFSQGSTNDLPLHGAVSVDVRDESGASIRVVNGTLLQAGVLIELSALRGADRVEVHSRDGRWWPTDSVVTVNRQVDLAILKSPVPIANAIPLPENSTYTDGGRLILVGGPGGEVDSTSVIAYRHFSLRGGFDLIPLSQGFPGGAPAIAPDGRLIGVAADLSTAEVSVGYLVPTASIRRISKVPPRTRPISDLAAEEQPVYRMQHSARGLALRGAILARSGLPNSAREFLTNALAEEEHSADAHYWMGDVLLQAREHQRAADSFTSAATADSTFHLAWSRAGEAYNSAGLYQEASAAYFNALEVDSCSAEAYAGLGIVRFNEERHTEAIEALRESISCDSTYYGGRAFYNLIGVYNAMDRREEAEEACDALARINPALAERARHMLDGHHH